MKKPSLVALSLLFATGAFLVFLADVGYSGRKEILLTILVLTTLWVALERRGTSMELVLLVLAWTVVGLVHEGLLVFAPATGVMFFAISPPGYSPLKRWLFSLSPSVSAGLVGISMLFFTSERAAEATCARWVELGAPTSVCEGAIEWIGQDLRDATSFTSSFVTPEYWVTYIPFHY